MKRIISFVIATALVIMLVPAADADPSPLPKTLQGHVLLDGAQVQGATVTLTNSLGETITTQTELTDDGWLYWVNLGNSTCEHHGFSTLYTPGESITVTCTATINGTEYTASEMVALTDDFYVWQNLTLGEAAPVVAEGGGAAAFAAALVLVLVCVVVAIIAMSSKKEKKTKKKGKR